MEQFNWIQRNAWFQRCAALSVVLLGILCARPAQALPIFARQTGMACLACHTVYPELTHFGRMFKLNGYQLDNTKDIQVTQDNGKQQVAIPALPPLAVFVQEDYTHLAKALPDSQIPGTKSQTDQVGFPQQVSLLWGGKIAPHFGAFAQLTYDYSAGSVGMDNTDLRFANNFVLPDKSKLTYGVSINNNPGVQDIWNTQQPFGFPYVGSEAAVGSVASPIMLGTLQAAVAGISGFVMWNEQLFGEVGIYHHAPQGKIGNQINGGAGPLDSTSADVLASNAPYWRVAYEYDIDSYALEVGAYGMQTKFYPGLGTALHGPTNDHRDVGEDFQLQYIGEAHIVTVKGTHIQESSTNNAEFLVGATNLHDSLNYFEADATYYYQRKIGTTWGYFSTTGTTDALEFPSAPTVIGTGPTAVTVGVTNSFNSNPATQGFVAELNYLPWMNVKMTLQYTHYSKFNGAVSNYDGVGRNASDNDTTYLNLWFAF
jgi:hypothetical protein